MRGRRPFRPRGQRRPVLTGHWSGRLNEGTHTRVSPGGSGVSPIGSKDGREAGVG